MKKLITLVAVASMLIFGATNMTYAQDGTTDSAATEQVDSNNVDTSAAVSEQPVDATANGEETQTFHQILKEKFIDGGAEWMTPILLVFVLGLALIIERIVYLSLSRTNTKKLLAEIEQSLEANDVESAKEICRTTRGPVASVFYQGLDRFNEDLDVIEKSIVSYGGVQMGRLESNLSWIGLFIALAPMLGFTGTVIGMIAAFDNIEAQGDISPTVVAGGMKVALLTTVFGLIVAIILQILYNFVVTIIEKLVNDMEDSTISFMDIIYKVKNN
jgi:biopolymer transport protein ExbB